MNKICTYARRIVLAILSLALPLGAIAAAVPTAGQPAADLADLSLEQLMEIRIEKVFSASKYEQKVTRAPASVTIVTGNEIEKFGHRTIADVMRSVRGFYVSNDNNYSYLGARGFQRPGDYNTRVLVLVDGHRMNDNIYDAAYIGRENTIDVDMVERIEVVRGPSSSIYGNSAFFGVINVVTKRGAQFEGGVVSAEVGSFDTYKGRMTVGGVTRSGADWLFSASRFSSGGQKQIYYPEFDQRISRERAATNNGVAENWDGERADNIYSRVSAGDVTISGFFNRRRREVPTASFGTIFNDHRQKTDDARTYLDAKLDRELMPDLQLLGRVFYDNYRYSGDYPTDYTAPGDPPYIALNKDFAHGEWAGTEWQANARLADRHLLMVGGEFRENIHQDQFNYDQEPRIDYLNYHASGRTLGLYAQLESALTANLVLNAGIRYDHYYGSFGGTTNPRFGLIYNAGLGTTFKALYGQAFRAPNVYERNFFPAQLSLPALRPETIRTTELAWEQYLGRIYRFSVSGYRYDVAGLINQSIAPADGRLIFENLDGAHATGVEFELEGRWDAGVTARVSYARQRATDRVSGLEMTSSPRDLAKLNLILPLARDKFFLGIEAQYHGEVITLDGQRARDFAIGNLTLTARQFRKGWDASVSAYNLFDTHYGYPGAEDHTQDVLPQEGRNLRLKLTYRF